MEKHKIALIKMRELKELLEAPPIVEDVVGNWLKELLRLPVEASFGLVTGAQGANTVCLGAARHYVLAAEGWDVERQGLSGAPRVRVVAGAERHATIDNSLRLLGLGDGSLEAVGTDAQGAIDVDELVRVLAAAPAGPTIVCLQAGNVNTGAFDPIADIAPIVRDAGGWLHVDGAFGAWAAASPELRGLTTGLALADSVSVDGHKWLNVPYDCGFVFVRDREAHRAAMTLEAPYYAPASSVARANHNWVPEASRRARGFAVYAALRSLGRDGLAQLVERCARLARRMADQLARRPNVHVLNDVVLNQVLVRFDGAGGDADARTAAVIRRVQDDGTCWVGGTTWHGMHVMRVSVSNWSTTESDIDLSAAAILRCAALGA